MNCGNCKFGVPTKPNTVECHRYPPRGADIHFKGKWVLMDTDEWCGEYKTR